MALKKKSIFPTILYSFMDVPVHTHIHIIYIAQSAGVVEYTDCFSAEGKPPPTSVLDMTLNNLMVRFQQCWSFGECRVLLYCHRSQVHSGP